MLVFITGEEYFPISWFFLCFLLEEAIFPTFSKLSFHGFTESSYSSYITVLKMTSTFSGIIWNSFSYIALKLDGTCVIMTHTIEQSITIFNDHRGLMWRFLCIIYFFYEIFELFNLVCFYQTSISCSNAVRNWCERTWQLLQMNGNIFALWFYKQLESKISLFPIIHCVTVLPVAGIFTDLPICAILLSFIFLLAQRSGHSSPGVLSYTFP